MSSWELIDHVAASGGSYTGVTLRDVIQNEASHPAGLLTRVQVGVFRLRVPGEQLTEGRRVARDWVLDALVALHEAGLAPVTRREVEAELATRGLRYSERAVNKGLTDLVRDPTSGVAMTVDQRYRLGR